MPNLQGRTPTHTGDGFVLGELGGEQAHTLTISEIPTHVHTANAVNVAGTSPISVGNMVAKADHLYGPATSLTSLVPSTVGVTGGSQAHQNMQPFLVLNFCIALQGIFPTQN